MIKDMKTRISKLNIDFDFEAYWEIIYLILLAFFVGMRFLLSTMFTIYWPKYFYRTLTVMGMVLVLMHLMLAKDIKKKEILAMAVVTFVFIMSHYVSGYDFLVDLLILILGAYRVNFRNILKTYIAVWSVLLVVTIIGAMTGLAKNLVYYQGECGERVRMALGICYPTDLAAYVVFLMFAYVCVRDEYITYLEIGVMAVLAGAVYYITDARTDFIVMILVLVSISIYRVFENDVNNLMGNRIVEIVIVLFPLIICAICWGLTITYTDSSSLLFEMNQGILSNRLALGKQAVDDYGVTLFGQYVYEKGFGAIKEWDGFYFFIDCSYVSIGIKYGLVLLIYIVLEIMLIICKMISKHKYHCAVIFIIICMQSMMEHHFIQYWYNPMLLAAFSLFLSENNDVGKCMVIDLN